ncbi:D-arabinitol dehydrogenase 1-like isoform X2 [Sitophilus oryzae]|uniref:D-arabinitol dehydrogenase 1-like isoform X2 n=1 Tax=Sitophilus oryzae TaxID=7048 RepID=A0A6J2Y195_SITOR|nr:D-arabinitol dehydrogenase 1-like isoform X2 [Sitophilus oryzae]
MIRCSNNSPLYGDFPCSQDTFTLGHEFSGTVVEVGSAVQNVKKGDRVVVDPNDGCRCCDFCHSGNPHFCKIGGQTNLGVHRNGGWGTYALVPTNLVQKLPENISLEQGALAEPISCLSHGWDLLSPVPVGSRILVIGAGIIGSLWACILHLQGHRRVTVSEPNTNRLNILKKLDTGYDLVTPNTLTKSSEDPNYKFDIVVDCSGYCPAIEQGLGLLDKGGKLCCFGVPPPGAKISVAPFDLYDKEITIFAVKVNPFSFVKSIGFLTSLGSRYLDYGRLGIEVFDLKDYPKALEALKLGKVAKAVFRL